VWFFIKDDKNGCACDGERRGASHVYKVFQTDRLNHQRAQQYKEVGATANFH